ncbi:hypothetical protein LXL04_010393 [Taraxacum kok-saghyz]
METLVSTWSRTAQVLPENYVFPAGERPGSVGVPLCQNIPVIDLSPNQEKSQSQTVEEILAACQEFGFFQVVNHGVSEDLIDDTMKVAKDFFDLPDEEKAKVYSTDSNKTCRLFTSSYTYDKEQLHFWRDNLRHPCHPLDECIHLWPENPTNYRHVVGKYSLEVRKLSLRILGLIREGLGLEDGYFGEELTGAQVYSVNHYPPCPNPSLTFGLPKHADFSVITVLLQGSVSGLQVYKDGEWLGIEPIPHAFVVNIGHQLQIISNGKLRSAEHRAVTNSQEARTTILPPPASLPARTQSTFYSDLLISGDSTGAPPLRHTLTAGDDPPPAGDACFQRYSFQRRLQPPTPVSETPLSILASRLRFTMAKLVSSWSNGVKSVPNDYIMPPERRPGNFVAVCKEIPVIDLQNDRYETVQQILKACQEFGLFQVINHGVSKKMMADIRVLYDEFFNMSMEDKLGLYAKTYGKGCTLHTSGVNYANEKVHLWKDTLKHNCHPLEEHNLSWPEKPARYREEVGRYAIEVRKMGFKILNLIREGLGLTEGYFDRVSQEQYMAVHLYPQAAVPGSNNERLKSVEHRVVTNSTAARTSICTFFSPSPTLPVEKEIAVIIEPAKELVTSSSPTVFKSFQYKDFVADYLAFMRKPLPRDGTPLDPYRL